MLEHDLLITNGPPNTETLARREAGGWKIAAIVPAHTIHPHALLTDMAIFFTKFIKEAHANG